MKNKILLILSLTIVTAAFVASHLQTRQIGQVVGTQKAGCRNNTDCDWQHGRACVGGCDPTERGGACSVLGLGEGACVLQR